MKIKQMKMTLLALDLKYCLYLNQLSRTEYIARFFKVVSRLGDGVFWYSMLVLVWFMQGIAYTLQLIYLVFTTFIATLIYKLLKHKTVRPRPYQVHQVIRLGERPLDHFSFPSGHTLHAVMITTVLGSIQPILLLLMLPFTILVALSRMILGLHYPSDVAVGALLGAFLAVIVLQSAPVLGLVL